MATDDDEDEDDDDDDDLSIEIRQIRHKTSSSAAWIHINALDKQLHCEIQDLTKQDKY